VAHDHAQRLGAQAAALVLRPEEDVHVGVAAAGVRLLPELDRTGRLAVHHDREALDIGLRPERPLVRRRIPPARHHGIRTQLAQPLRVLGPNRLDLEFR
jgi:hypothetical protein